MTRYALAPAICFAALALAGCVTVEAPESRAVAAASLARGDGAPAGTASIEREGDELVIRVEARGLAPGLHGLHVHAAGRCDAPDFSTAQGHWNPGGRAHGTANPAGSHAGDLPNIAIGADGRGRLRAPLNSNGAAAGIASLFDGDGSAVVIHAGADDMRTDPSGASGGRIACGVLVRR